MRGIVCTVNIYLVSIHLYLFMCYINLLGFTEKKIHTCIINHHSCSWWFQKGGGLSKGIEKGKGERDKKIVKE